MSEGVKNDDGKTDWTLVPWEGLGAVVEVLAFGARKYSRDNWRIVPDARDRYVKATLRHVVSLARGEWADLESGLPHAAHAACCLLFVLALASEKPEKTP